MFVLTTIADTVRIQPHMFFRPTLDNIHDEIEKKYPNRVLMDVGLVVCRYGDALEVGDGVLAAGDGASHHEVVFRLVVFRPFVEEVCLGVVAESTEEGVRVSLGFFDDIFVPAYWMLRPSTYDEKSGLWVWTPSFNDDDDDDDDGGEGEGEGGDGDGGEGKGGAGEESPDGDRFEMEIGSEIRFRVKSINFTRITNTAKGVQATTTTTKSHLTPRAAESKGASAVERTLSGGGSGRERERSDSAVSEGDLPDRPVRKRSTSVDLSDTAKMPATMHITASICEDGLGLTSWWTAPAEEEDDVGEEGAHGEGVEEEQDEEYYEQEYS